MVRADVVFENEKKKQLSVNKVVAVATLGRYDSDEK